MRIGIDLGGTKIEAVALDATGGEVVRRRVATPAGDYDATIAAVAEQVLEVESLVGEPCSVGIGTPGAISPFTGLLRNSNSVALNGRPVDGDLARALDRPVRLANDANCFALSEAVDGAGQGAGVVFGVILGTGVGGGLVVNGQVLGGPNAIAGEWGHNELPGETGESRDCYCGRVNCIERFLCGPAFAGDYVTATGVDLSAEEVAELVGSDGAMTDALDRYIARLVRALSQVINIVDPDVIVLGGGMSNVDGLYNRVPAQLGRWVFSDDVATSLVKNHHGDSSGVRGAAWLWS